MLTAVEHRQSIENIVTRMHETLSSAHWTLMAMNADETGTAFLSTYGMCSAGLPDIVLGFQINEESRTTVQFILNSLCLYFHDLGEPVASDFDLDDFIVFVQQEYTNPDDLQYIENCIRNFAFTLRELDPVVWFNGHGLHHRSFYPVDVRMSARVFQLVLVDEMDREPRDEGFVGHRQRDFVRLGEEPVKVNVNPNLTKYLH